MRTINAAAIIAKRLEANLAKYPKGSLSNRQVLLSLPGGEHEFGLIDCAITTAIWNAALAGQDVTSDVLTRAAQRAAGMSVKEPRPPAINFKEFLKKKPA